VYLDFFGLEREPFHITPDPEFLFPSPGHKEAFATVMYGVQQQKGFVVVTGEVGTGKTTVLRAYLQKLKGSDIQPIYIFDPHLAFDELLEAVLTELGAPSHEGQSQFARLQWLRHYLIDAYSAGKSVVLIIDEAQNMPVETLEQLRVLTNLETTKDQLLQVLLVGQPELEDKLSLHQLRQLAQRVAVRATLRPLSDEEAADYVKHRVRQAGGTPETIFTPAALKAIVKHAKGNPRVLNIVCDNVLVNAYGAQQMPISHGLVKEVIRELSPQLRRTAPAFDWRHLAPVATAAAIALVAGAASLGMWRAQEPAAAAANAPATATLPGPELPSVPGDQLAALAPAPDGAVEYPQAAADDRFDPRAIALNKLRERNREREEIAREAEARLAAEKASASAPVNDAVEEVAATPAQEQAQESPAETIVATGILESMRNTTVPAEQTEAVPGLDGGVQVDTPAPSAATPEPAPAVAPVEALAEPASSEGVQPAPPVESPAVESEAPERVEEAMAAPAAVEEKSAVAAAPAAAGMQRVRIERGDTLIELLVRHYGYFDAGMIAKVQALNPGIEDPNRILAGFELLLPEIAKAESAAPGDSEPALAN
jgi:general secretion pathway protein A